jgi:hypothetical protein
VCVCVCLCVIYICIYSPSVSASDGTPPAEHDAYPFKRGDACGVPHADVCVKCRRKAECLQAEPNAVHVDGKCSHVSARIRVRHGRTRARIGGAVAHDGHTASNIGRARPLHGAPPAESGAYIGQRGDRGGVPCADVRVERRRDEHLRAEPRGVYTDGWGSCVSTRNTCAPDRTRTRGCTRTHTWAHTWGTLASVIRSAWISIHACTCISHAYEYYTAFVICAASIASERERVAIAHMPGRAVSSAHARKHASVMQQHYIYIRIYIGRVRSYIYRWTWSGPIGTCL